MKKTNCASEIEPDHTISSVPEGDAHCQRRTEMTAADVIDLYTKLSDLGVQIWIDGGWGVGSNQRLDPSQPDPSLLSG